MYGATHKFVSALSHPSTRLSQFPFFLVLLHYSYLASLPGFHFNQFGGTESV